MRRRLAVASDRWQPNEKISDALQGAPQCHELCTWASVWSPVLLMPVLHVDCWVKALNLGAMLELPEVKPIRQLRISD